MHSPLQDAAAGFGNLEERPRPGEGSCGGSRQARIQGKHAGLPTTGLRLWAVPSVPQLWLAGLHRMYGYALWWLVGTREVEK